MLSWRSDEALRLYARLNDATYGTWVDEAATAEIESIRSSNIAAVAEAQAAAEAREWLRKSAAAKVLLGLTSVRSSPTPFIYGGGGTQSPLVDRRRKRTLESMVPDTAP